MNYIPLNEFKKAWVFRHQDLKIAPTDLEKIRLMSPTRSAVLWSTMVSREKDHPDFFTENEWAGQPSSWQENLNWEKDWEAGLEELPESINEFLKWENNTTVYFCLNRDGVIETSLMFSNVVGKTLCSLLMVVYYLVKSAIRLHSS